MTDDRRASRPTGVDEAAGEPTPGNAREEWASKRMVVVGGGLAGVRTCQELRAQGFTGELHLVRAETGPPYDRPPLSKGRDGHRDADLAIDLAPLDLHDHPGMRASGLVGADPGSHPGERTPLRVRLAVAEPPAAEPPAAEPPGTAPPAPTDLPADAVVAASGAHPILPAAWATGPHVRVLRTRDDAAALWNTLDAAGPGARVAVLGGSWIGLEFATVALDAGFDVTVFERAPQLLPLLPPEVGRAVQRWCNESSVVVHLGEAVESVTPTQTRITVTTATFTDTFDVVLVGLGVAPTTQWLAESGLALTPAGALRVDAHLRSGDPRVIGTGDCIERWSPRYQAWLPGGHWQDARDQPVVAATSALAALGTTAAPAAAAPAAAPAAAAPATPAATPTPETPTYDAVPYFWSEMFGHTLQFSGFVPDHRSSRVVVRGDLDEPAWALAWIDDRDRLQALLACDRPRDAITARKILKAHPDGLPAMDPVALADPQTPLVQCLRDHEGARP